MFHFNLSGSTLIGFSVLCYFAEKPSYPVCAIHGDVATGHLVTLTCHSSKGSPSPEYKWTRIVQGMKEDVQGTTSACLCVYIDAITSITHLIKDNNFVLCFVLDLKTGVLYIRNISQFQFGTYQCNASNTVGFSTCTVELSSGTSQFLIFFYVCLCLCVFAP